MNRQERPVMASAATGNSSTENGNALESTSGSASAPKDANEAIETVTQSLWEMWEGFLSHLPLLGIGLVVLIVTWGLAALVSRIVANLAERASLRHSMRDLLRQMAYAAVWIIGITVAAVVVFPGMTPTKILTVLGLSSIAIGFAFKDIVENFFAGVLILWRFPFEPGDFIECEGIAGKVVETTIRMTLIRQVDGQLVVVPNAMLFKNPVNILTDRDVRRTTIICGVAYDEDVDQSRKIITEAVRDCKSVSSENPVEIFAQEFGASSVNFEVTWWAKPTPLDIRKSRDEVVAAVKRALDDAGIEIPFPYRTLTFKEPLSLANGSDRENLAGAEPSQERATN